MTSLRNRPSSMRHLFLFLAAAIAVSPAQVPKPPWAGAAAPARKAPAAGTSSADAAPNPDATIKVDVKLVNVFVTVTDDHGAPVGGLIKDNFELLEDGAPQTISMFDKESALPLSIVMDIDTSLSTRKDLPLELTSARRFAHAILRPVDALCLYEFSETVDEIVPFTPDLKAIDGGDTVSRVDYKEAVRAAQEAEVIVYSIIVVPIEASAGRELGGEHALIQISEDTGGKYFYATSVPQLDEAFRKISDELRTQYLLAYYPSRRSSDSSFRHIDVKVTGIAAGPAFLVRHRAGYYTRKSHF